VLIGSSYEDGSLLKLWDKFYAPNLTFVKLENRLIFKIDNPYIEDLDKSYEQFIYQPIKNH